MLTINNLPQTLQLIGLFDETIYKHQFNEVLLLILWKGLTEDSV